MCVCIYMYIYCIDMHIHRTTRTSPLWELSAAAVAASLTSIWLVPNIYGCCMCWTCNFRAMRAICRVFSSWSFALSCTLYVSMYGSIISCQYVPCSCLKKKQMPVILLFQLNEVIVILGFSDIWRVSLLISYIEFPPLNAVFARRLHSSNHPPVLAFEICEGNDFHLQTNCYSR